MRQRFYSCIGVGLKAGPAFGVALARVAAALSACNDRSAAPNRALFVRTELVQPLIRQRAVTLTGEVQARFRADLSFRVSGRVVARFADVGAHVDAGDVLARLEPAEQQADVDAAAAAEAAAEAQLRVASATFERQKTLIAEGFTTRVVFDKAQEGLRNAEASLEAAKAQLGTAKDALGYTELRAGDVRRDHRAKLLKSAKWCKRLSRYSPWRKMATATLCSMSYESIFLGDYDGEHVSLALLSDPNVTATAT